MGNSDVQDAVTGIVLKSVKKLIGHVISSTVNLHHLLTKLMGKEYTSFPACLIENVPFSSFQFNVQTTKSLPKETKLE